jgi:hypothetical protein
MQKQSMWASALLLALAGLPATAQEGRPAGSDQGRGQAAPAAQPQRGEPRPAGERPKDGDRAQPADRPGAERGPTDRAPQGQPARGTPADRPADRPQTDAAHGLAPADRLAQLERKNAMMTARIERLMEVYREKDDKAKLLELEQLRERAKNQHQKGMAELERELGPERFRAARAAYAEKNGGAVPSERGREIRTERAAAEEKARGETDAAKRGEQARKEQAHPTDQAKDKPARPPAGGKPADKPADKPAKPAGGERERDGGAS